MEALCFFCETMQDPNTHHCVPDKDEGYEFELDGIVYRDKRPSLPIAFIMHISDTPYNRMIIQELPNGRDVRLYYNNSIDLRTNPKLLSIPLANP